MRAKLIKKEFALSAHPTNYLFLAFCLFVLIPNYPYEVAFFFSGLGTFFVCLTARENGDLYYTCALPVKKGDVALARVLFCMIFQCALLLLTGIAVLVKEVCFPPEMQINLAGSCANLALLGHGGVLLGTFNLIFFPLYFRNPVKVGRPFVLASAVQFVAIAALCALRFTAPVYSDLLVAPDPANMAAKAAVFSAGIVVYAACSAAACVLSQRRFEATDL